MKKRYLIILLLLLIFPLNVFALSSTYVDKVGDITNTKVENDKINFYLFHGEGCPHCKDEKSWIETIKDKYKDKVNFYYFEVWHNTDNANKMKEVKNRLSITSNGVPLTIIGDKFFLGYSETTASRIISVIDEYLKTDTKTTTKENTKEETKDKKETTKQETTKEEVKQEENKNNSENNVKKEENKNNQESNVKENDKEEVKENNNEDTSNNITLPFLGDVNTKEVSIPLVAVILGFIDGFNPCAMWILLFLINMLFQMKDKKKAWFLGLLFLFISGLVYFLSMLGINIVLNIMTINWMKIAIAIFILSAGILNLVKYIKTRKENAACTVVDDKKRKNIISKMKKIVASKSFILSIIGIITLAVSVNLIELACSLGFPVIFSELLSINNINGLTRIIFLLIYIFFYLIDDIVVFSISMFTLQATGITNKYNKLCTLVSAIIMILMGLLLIFKPEWLMLNF